MNLSERISKLIETKGVTAYEISLKTGISQSSLSRLLNDNTTKLNIKNTDLLAKYFNVNREWLLNGNGDMYVSKSEAIQVKNPDVISVPFISQYGYAGYLAGFADTEYVDVLPKVPFFVNEENPKGNYVCIEVKGDSMNNGTEDSIVEGDKLLCREIKRELWKSKLHIRKWDFAIVHRTDGILIKRIIKHDTELCEITIHSLNDEYPDRVLKLNEIAQLFNIIEISRQRRR